ncbi:MAG: UDP-glucose/GDP-mannose dehydrogenase family protein [Verrucomicrobia bacterium]|nr:MAG: UDP-glucose/GDP-mannose dehydrogenase family protein [Verrucomicrobiota bacterium]
MKHHISVFGLGKLGASMVAAMASRGFHVIGVDILKNAVDALNTGLAPVQETGLEEMLTAYRHRIRATLNSEDAIRNSSLSFIIVPTPSDERGAFSLKYAEHAITEIGRALARKNEYHVVVVTSTVLPGATRYGLLPILEAASGKKCGQDFGLCYSPEFIALGTTIRDLLNPDFFLIGQFDDRSGDALEAIYRQVCLKNLAVHRMSMENAEIAKIALNSYVTLKISFSNVLADLCERIPGGNVDVVSAALGADSRIGRKYLTGGMGFAGPCFPRDNVALNFIGSSLGANCNLLQSNDAYNQAVLGRFIEKIKQVASGFKTIAVLGLAYKQLSHVIDHSPGIALACALAEAGYQVTGYDPLANDAARIALRHHAHIADSLEQCLKEAEVILVTTRDAAFQGLTAADFLQSKNQVTIVDFWRCLHPSLSTVPGIRYIPIGRCFDDETAALRIRELWEKHSSPIPLCIELPMSPLPAAP